MFGVDQILVIKTANLEIDETKNLWFSKFDLTPQLHLFFLMKNATYLNFTSINDRTMDT